MADFPNIPIDASVSQLNDLILNGITRSKVDDTMSDDSINPVQNKTIKQYVDDGVIQANQYTDNAINKSPKPEIPETIIDNEMSDESTNARFGGGITL